MRIDAMNKVSQLYQANRTRKTGSAGAASRSDKVEISRIGKDYQIAKQAIAKAPDVRMDKVASLKAAFANGTYNVSDEALADKMLDDYFDLPF